MLTIEDNGKHIVANNGDEVLVLLRTNPSTGYDWIATPVNPAVLTEEERTYAVLSNAMGSPNDLLIHYRVTGSGHAHIELQYRRSWENGVAAVQIFTIEIDSREK